MSDYKYLTYIKVIRIIKFLEKNLNIDILDIKTATFYYKLKHLGQPKKEKKITYDEKIKETFKECKSRYGRERLSFLLKKKYKIYINTRTLGRNINKLGLFCEVRQKKEKEKIKI
ncbi:Uncharacterised protein [Chlamydia abortus]|nr:Uncharacterised protein [Chlamydia abortus]SGA31713.1 Uncharacterised protein [Chlamydia abortus]SGA32835.1 Uncharacterised protein [Chlamydia abortus]SHE15506.1 Uncharacterised protein [Chlamydia abortus]